MADDTAPVLTDSGLARVPGTWLAGKLRDLEQEGYRPAEAMREAIRQWREQQ